MKSKCFGKRLTKLQSALMSMKMTALMTASLVTMATADSYGQRIQLNVKNQSLREVLSQLEDQSGYSFIYDSRVLNSSPLTLNLVDESLESALGKLSRHASIDYSIVNKTVTLKKAKSLQNLVSIKGQVLLQDDDKGTKLPSSGVMVSVKGTSKSTATNNDGEFKIEAATGTTIVFSYIGYQKKEFKIEDLLLNGPVVLTRSSEFIDEVVVMAYGKKESRENQTGSAFTVTAKDLENRPALRIDALLEGIVPGVEFASQDGGSNASPRPRYSTRVRGEASSGDATTSNEPLWVIDGVPLYTGGVTNQITGTEVSISPLTYLDPNDIETITVLKDASATTIYGANGSNGVILITTKKGYGKAKVRYGYRSGINKRSDTNFRYLDGPQYLSIVKRMGMLDQLGKIDTSVNTYWPDYYFRTGQTSMHNIDVSGSSADVSYFMGAGIYDEKLITIGNNTKRYSFRTNLSANISKKLSVQGGLNVSYNSNDMFNPGNSFFDYSPLIRPVGPNGEYIERDPNNRLLLYMPGMADQNDHQQKAVLFTGNIGFTFNIFDRLNFVNRNGADISSVNENRYYSMYNNSGSSSNGIAFKNQNQVVNLISTNTLNYDRKILNGDFDIMVGTEARQRDRNSVSAQGSNFPNDNIREISFTSTLNRTGTASRDKETLLSYFGRAGYVYDGRYALNYTYRKDGSSNFGKDVKWGNFSSLGAAWTVSNESFWKKDGVVDFLKFKASYGTNGNSRFSSSYAKGVYKYDEDLSYGPNGGAVMSRGVNDNLKWETTNMFNTGVDFGLFKRINVAAEYYKNVTNDMIANSYVTMTSGFRTIYQNIGKIQNTGFEATISSKNIDASDFKWDSRLMLSLNRNKILELSEGIDRISGNSIKREGYDSNSLYMVRWAGVDPSTGDPMWYDANGNITKSYTTNNRVIVGSSTPEFYGGFTNNFNYKGFHLSVFLKYNKGGYYFDQMSRNIGQDGLYILDGNQSINVLNSWQYPGYLATEPRLSNVSTGSIMNSTRYLLDKTYMSLENISLSYSLKKDFVKRLHVSNVNLTAMASKLAMWTPYSAKKGVARAYENMSGYEYLSNTTYLYNTYAEMFDSNSRVANYSFAINVTF